MNAQERTAAIANYIRTATPATTGLRIKYHGEIQPFSAYEIPLDYLVYNPYNGRIGSVVKTYERQNHVLDVENPDDVKLIEDFLWNSKLEANKKTRQSLLDDHQKQYGIVTADGMIIDGNRRASLLNSLRRDESIPANRKQHCERFLAVVLPGDADKKEILRLETTFQMGEDAKVDYNPIEKYLKCQDLREAGFTESEIATYMGDSVSNIRMYIEVLKLMNEYLEYYGYDGMYTLLDKNEDSFQKLNSALKGYKAGSVSNMWDFDPELDTEDLKVITFDFIRFEFSQMDIRDLFTKPTATNPNKSFFGCKDVWESFRDYHFENIEPITNSEETVEDIIQNANGGDVTRLLRARDSKWKNKVKPFIQENYGKSKEKLSNKQAADNPLKLLQKALEALESVDTTQDTFKSDPQVLSCLKEINRTSWEYKKLLEK